jgi:hypothetical protein
MFPSVTRSFFAVLEQTRPDARRSTMVVVSADGKE